jgi:hypothetical protein
MLSNWSSRAVTYKYTITCRSKASCLKIVISGIVSGLYGNTDVILVLSNICSCWMKQHSYMQTSLTITTATGGHSNPHVTHEKSHQVDWGTAFMSGLV